MEPNEMERFGEYEQINGFVANRLMDYITALQAKIDGMIPRPTIGVVLRDSVYFITINGMECDTDDAPTTYNACKQLVTNYKKALGMDDAKEGGSDA